MHKYNILKIYGTKNGEEKVIFETIEKEALIEEGVKKAEEDGYVITEMVELAQWHNNFTESRLTHRGMHQILERSKR